MAVIQVLIGKNTIKDVLLDWGSRINIITKQLRLKLGLPKPKHAPYNLKMANQTTTKPVALIRDLKIYVHGIPYITMFTILQNIVVDSSYSMLLGRPWLKDVKMAHDCGNNIITIQRNGTIRIIIITKHLGAEIKKTISVIMLWLSKWYHIWKKYHLCYEAKIVFMRRKMSFSNQPIFDCMLGSSYPLIT